jgi:DNA polymerase-3 subunit gamma/tau
VASGRLAHAYLLCGPRGTGKTSLGRLIAKAANCGSPLEGEPCNSCESCLAFLQGRAIDFVEQDAASHNSVDDIRQLRENVALTPMSGKRKVYLLDEVHMLSKGAYNALLKTLEEPPPHIIFVLATTEVHKVEATIISRCQRFDLRRIPMAAAVQWLTHICREEGFTLDEASLEEIARSATGSLRDAMNGLEQVVTYYGPSPTLEQVQEALGLRVDARAGELARLALAGDLAGGLKLIAGVRDDGADMKQFCRQVVQYLRGLLLAKAGVLEGLELPREAAEQVKAVASGLQRAGIVRALRAFGQADFRDDSSATGGSLPLELALVDLADNMTTGHESPKVVEAVAVRPEPQFSIPVAETDDVASTVTSATLGPPIEETAIEVPLAQVESLPEINEDADLLERVRQACKDGDKQLSGLLNGSCEVKSEAEGVVTLGFYHTFHLERIESGPFARIMDELFSNALGRTVKVAYEHTPRERTKTPVKSGHLVQAAREMLGDTLAKEGGEDGEPGRE